MTFLQLISRTTCVFVVSCFLPGFGFAQAPTYTPKFSPALDDNINGFWEYLPRDYETDQDQKYPLIIYIHGAGDQGSMADISTLNKINNHGPARLINNGHFPESFTVGGMPFRFIVISPQIKNGVTGLTSTISATSIDAVVEYAINQYRVDESRIYIVGMSMGGGGTWIYASSETGSKKIAAIVTAAGAYDLSTEEAHIIATENIAVLATHNMVDNIVLAQRTINNIEKINAIQPAVSPEAKMYLWNTAGENDPAYNDAAHNAWSRTFEDLGAGSTNGGNLTDSLGINVYEWLLSNQNLIETVPVTWQQFLARDLNGKTLLQWKVTSQVNVKHYIVEKSVNNIDFRPVATLNAKSIAGDGHAYEYIDRQAATSPIYYRIRQVDNDNLYSFSVVRRLSYEWPEGRVTAFPNPFQNGFIINLPALAPQIITVRVSDIYGRMVFRKQLSNPADNIFVEGRGMASKGIYLVSVTGQDGRLLYAGRMIKP